MVVRYPRSSGIAGDVWSGPLNSANVVALIDSSLRQKIARDILAGASAVWVLLESGDQEKDEAAARLLQTELKKMEETLECPGPSGNFSSGDDRGKNDPTEPVSFSLMRLSRTDPAERMLLNMLLRSEWDLETFSEPMAFPIFGRGRILYALVGAGINEENIEEACSFLVGACLCQTKGQNPGIDLLMSVDWEAGIQDRWVDQPALPTLAGMCDEGAIAIPPAEDRDQTTPSLPQEEPTALLRNAAIAIVLGLAVVAVMGFLKTRKKGVRR